jgi:hypothetical protein
MNNITDLKNKYVGKDVYVLASGPSLNHIDHSFFDNKITVGVNRVGIFLECDYVVTKDSVGFGNIVEQSKGSPKILLSKYETGDPGRSLNSLEGTNVFVFDHFEKPQQQPQTGKINKDLDKLVVSYSTITTAIHAAAYMGAKNIIICGHDCGIINGESAIRGYHQNKTPHQGSEEGYVAWLSVIEQNTMDVKNKVMKEYGCNICSLNPFINFNLENNKYTASKDLYQLRR